LKSIATACYSEWGEYMATKKTGEFDFEFVGDGESIVKYLKALTEGFAKKQLVLGNEKKQLLFEPQGLVEFKVKAKRRNRDNKISIKFSWKENGQGTSSKKPLVINQQSS
jgi:amphi-Trp domain-containing protein